MLVESRVRSDEMKGWTIVKSNEMTPEEKLKARDVIKYPKIDHTVLAVRDILKYKQIEDPFFNILLNMEVKRDGSNLRLIAFKNYRVGVLSRNQYANDKFVQQFEAVIKQNPAKYEKLLDYVYDNDCVAFLELFGKGNSPTGFDRDEPLSLEVLDIYIPPMHAWLERKAYDDYLPTVPLIASGRAANQDEYAQWIDKCLDWCDAHGKEGVVLKGQHPVLGRVMTKEKVAKALAKPEKKPRPPKSTLPVLNISEINGAINKAHVELGDAIFDKKVAMPLVAKYIKEECKKHNCSSPQGFFNFYLKYLEGVKK